jgi:hypothetical protein
MSMQIKTDILKAMLVIAPTKDIRYYLNGVLVEASGAIVASDGHRLLAARCEADSDPDARDVIIPVEAVKQAISAKQPHVTLEGNKLGNVEFAPIDGTYANWRSVVPAELSPPDDLADVQFNASYVGDFGKVAKILTGAAEKMSLKAAKWDKASGVFGAILFAGREDVLGVLMPLRSDVEAPDVYWQAIRRVVATETQGDRA